MWWEDKEREGLQWKETTNKQEMSRKSQRIDRQERVKKETKKLYNHTKKKQKDIEQKETKPYTVSYHD